MIDFLTTEQLAARWKIHKMTLSRWRTKGTGPKYIKVGRTVLYQMAEIKRVESKTLFSTAGDGYSTKRHAFL